MATVEPVDTRKRRRKPAETKTKQTEKSKSSDDAFYDNLPFNMVVHGIPGIGKTSFAANAPKPYFLIDRQERGILKLKKRKIVDRSIPVEQIENWEDTISKIRSLADDSSFKTLVLDSLTGFEKLCFQYMCDKYYDGDWNNERNGFYAFSKGPKQAAKREWPELLDALTDLADAGKNTILIAHSQSKTFQNPEGPDYSRWVPYLDPETWNITFRWTEYTLFMGYQVAVKQEGLRNKVQQDQSGERFINLDWNPAYDAKCLSDCLPEVSMGDNGKEAWDNFWKEVN